MAGGRPLMWIHRIRSGDLFTVLGGSHVESIKYIVGNTFIAQKLFTQDLTTGLYVPFTINIYGRDGTTFMEYFQPSSFLVHVSNDPETNEVGRQLDAVMDNIVNKLKGN